MAALFYDHLIDWDVVQRYLDTHASTPQYRLQMLELMEENIHTETLIVILRLLPSKHHEEFLLLFHQAPYEPQNMEYLRHHIGESVEEQIRMHLQGVLSTLTA